MTNTSPQPIDDLSCRFWTCRSHLTSRFRGFLSSVHGVAAFGEVRACYEHVKLLEAADRDRGVTIRISLEGHVWIDNLAWIVYRGKGFRDVGLD